VTFLVASLSLLNHYLANGFDSSQDPSKAASLQDQSTD
jgi:hypothetical protein